MRSVKKNFCRDRKSANFQNIFETFWDKIQENNLEQICEEKLAEKFKRNLQHIFDQGKNIDGNIYFEKIKNDVKVQDKEIGQIRQKFETVRADIEKKFKEKYEKWNYINNGMKILIKQAKFDGDLANEKKKN